MKKWTYMTLPEKDKKANLPDKDFTTVLKMLKN